MKRITLKVHYKGHTEEWLVRVWIDGKYSEDATYYTDDEQDALDTMKVMAETYKKQGHQVEVR